MKTVTVRTLENIFDKRSRKDWEAPAWDTVNSYAPMEFQSDGIGIIHNGRGLSGEDAENTYAAPGDEVIFYRCPADPVTIVTSLVLSLVLTGISFAISALTAPTAPTAEKLEDSPTYGFDGLFNTIRPGTRIPIVYGKHRVGGQIINQFIRPNVGKPGTPTDPQSGELHSLIAVCSGPIESMTDIRVNKSPIADFGSDAKAEVRLGENHQLVLAGFRDVVLQTIKDAALKQTDDPVILTTTGQVDAFEIIFRFAGGLQGISSRDGSPRKKTIEFQIEYREFGTVFWIQGGKKVVIQKTNHPFDIWYQSPRLPRAQYDIRVTRLTPELSSAQGFGDSTLWALNNVTEEALTYPGVALLAVRQLPTNQISGRTPTYDSIVKGKLVRVFTSLTDFTIKWSDNNSWCLLDFLTSTDGLGAWISDADVDLQSFIDLAAFCDLMIAKDTKGTLEKQFTLNFVVDGTLTAIDVIKQMCSSCRAFFFLRGSKFAVRPDRPEAVTQFFSMGRIQRDKFSVSKVSRSNIATVITGKFWNEDLDYEEDSLPKEDQASAEGDDTRETTVNLVGVTRVSQANRILSFLELENRLSRRVVETEIGAEALVSEAGDVVSISHDVPGWGFSGKLSGVEADGNTLILDRSVTIETGKLYELTAIHDTDKIDVLSVVNNPETTNRLFVSGSWTKVPEVGTNYSFGEVGKSSALYRITSITKGSAPFVRKVRAKEYNEAIYGTDLTALPLPSVSRIPDPFALPDPVQNLRLAERLSFAPDGSLSLSIDVNFSLPIVAGVEAQVFWREKGEGLWDFAGSTKSGLFTIQNVRSPGVTYEVSVVTVSAFGVRTHPDSGVILQITTTGITKQPDIVAGFRADRTAVGLLFSWLPVTNPDVGYYEVRWGSSWDTATSLGRTTDLQLESSIAVKGAQTYWIRAFNASGGMSPSPTSLVIVVEARFGENVIFTQAEDPTFPGIKQAFVVTSSKLTLVPQVTSEGPVGLLNPQTGGLLMGGGRGAFFRVVGVYTTDPFQVTSGAAIRALVSTQIVVNQLDVSAYWTAAGVADKSWQSDFAKSRSWASAPEGRVFLKVEMRFSIASSADADFGPWQERPANIQVSLKWAQARITATIADPGFAIEIPTLRILIDVPDVVDSGSVTTDSSGNGHVSYNKTFNQTPKLAIAVVGNVATAGDDVFITNKNNTGFDIQVKNGGTGAIRTVDWNVIGF